MSQTSSPVITPATALAEVAAAATQVVAPYLRSVTRSAPEIGLKQDIHDPVTIHDQRTEGIIREFLAAVAPDSVVLGEEMGEEIDPEVLAGRAPYDVPADVEVSAEVAQTVADLGSRVRWIVDPIDGTANFAAGLTYFGTSIGVELDGEVVAGAISVPFTGEVFVADDKHAWHEDLVEGSRTMLRSEGPRAESEALIATYFPSVSDMRVNPVRSSEREAALMANYATLRRPGAAALDLAMVAAGWIGVSMGVSFKPWDVAAGIHMVKVAGGHVLNLPMGTDEPDGQRPGVVASVGTLDAVTAKRVLRDLDKESR